MQLRSPTGEPSPAATADFQLDAAFQLNERDFGRARHMIDEYAGIKLSPQKRNMVYNRLLRRLRAHGVRSFGAYLDLVQADQSAERQAFVNALTTNLTAFFREPHHFELLAGRAAERARKGAGPLRVWSSACSTGALAPPTSAPATSTRKCCAPPTPVSTAASGWWTWSRPG
jgi:chemotaxis protein methyltransferase CheR